MWCSRCRAENPEEKRFCGDCGAKLEVRAEPVAVPGEPGVFFCARHLKVGTRVRCGHCDAPICPRCTVYGPVGARCRACSRHRVRVRPMGVLHAAGRTIGDGARQTGRVVWYLALWNLVIGIIASLFGGHRDV